MIPAGIYNAVAVPVDTEEEGRLWAQFGEAKSGTKQVVVHFQILEGDHAGTRLPWFGFFTKDAARRTVEALRLAGFKGDDLATLPTQQLDQKVSVTVEHSEWEGKVRAKVAWVNRPGGGGVKLANPMGADKLRMFAAQMKTHVKGVAEVAGEKGVPGEGAPPVGPGPSGADGAANDDLPF